MLVSRSGMNVMSRRFWVFWTIGSLLWLIGLPIIFGVWIKLEVANEYLSGERIATDGDSIAIPIAGLAVINFAVVLLANVCLALYVFLIRRRT